MIGVIAKLSIQEGKTMFKGPAPRDAQRLVNDQIRIWEQGEKKRAGLEAPEQRGGGRGDPLLYRKPEQG